jgi:hypothetical protein
VTTLRGVLSAVAATVAALLGPGLVVAFRGINNSKATGLAAVAAGFLESLFSPLFWILALSLFALFFSASRLSSKPLRILLFWTPATVISTLGLGIFSLFTYAWIHFRKG